MSKPRVLVFIDWYAPGFKAGGPVRSVVNLVDHLRDQVDFHIVTTDTDYTETEPYPGIVPDRWTALPGGEQVWYASRRSIGRSVWNKLRAGQWDAVYINGVWSPWFSALPLWLMRGSSTRRIVAVRGMLAEGMMKHGTLKKRLFLAAMKLAACYRGVTFQATNADEERDVKRWISPDAVVHVLPNLGRKADPVPRRPPAKTQGSVRLVSVARIAVEKNTLFAIECLRGLEGDIVFDLYGPLYDEGYWRKCQEAIAQLPPNVKVAHQGTVPAEGIPELLSRYHAVFMPSEGENFGHAMAEALSAGLPLLISDRTPWRGLEKAGAGCDLSLNDPAAFTAVLRRLVTMDDAELTRMSDAARQFAAEHDRSASVVAGMLKLFGRS